MEKLRQDPVLHLGVKGVDDDERTSCNLNFHPCPVKINVLLHAYYDPIILIVRARVTLQYVTCITFEQSVTWCVVLLSTDKQMISARKAIGAHAKDFVVNELKLPILKASAHYTRSPHVM